jgi:bile acid:Na+ symporter, BASS family
MLSRLNYQLERFMPIITPTGVLIGVFFSGFLKDFSYLIPWIFAFMTFQGSLSMNFRSLKDAILHPLPVIITLGFLHLLMPLIAWSFGQIAFTGDNYTITGLILGMVIPTGVTSFVWVTIYKGNKALTLSIILIDSLLSPFIVPSILSILVGEKVELDVTNMMLGLLYMIVVPSILAMLLNDWTNGTVNKTWRPRLAPFSKLSLGIVVALNGAVVAPYLKDMSYKLAYIILSVFLIAALGYFLAYLIGKWLKFDQETIISLTYCGGMRNISAGAVMAISYFPSQVVIPVVVAMLFQQLLASLYGTFLSKFLIRKNVNHHDISA